MDKRKQFQLQILTNKLSEYTSKLEILKSKQCELITIIQNSTANNNNISILLENKIILESKIQKYKNELVNFRSEYIKYVQQLKTLPELFESNKAQEQAIFDEEIYNITGKILKANQDHLEILTSLEVEKTNLSTQILDLQSQLATTQNNISSIQENAHSFRKNTLLELQQKKQQKLIINTTLEELNKNKEFYITSSSKASNYLESLITFKTNIINIYYTNPETILLTPNATDLLPTELLNISQSTNFTKLFNTIIQYLDKQIQETKYIISNILKKADRLDKSIITTSNELNIKLEPTSRKKVISYKNNYKNAKLEKTALEEELKTLQSKFDSWDTKVLYNATLEYKKILNSLEEEKQRACERLNIMISRITSEHESTSITLADKIKYIENEITNINNILKLTNLELTTVLKEISQNDSTKIELDKIHIQITNVEFAINNIQQDITSINS